MIAAVLVLLLAGPGEAGAGVPSTSTSTSTSTKSRPVILAVACASVSAAALRALLRAELGPLLLDGDEPEAERVVVSCAGETANVTVSSPPEAPVERTVSLAGFPADARPRLLALVAVELIAARRPEVRQRLVARETVRPTPPAVVAPAPKAPARELRVLAGGGGWAFLGARGLAGWTVGVRLEPALGRRLGLAFDVELGGGRRSLDAGAIGAWLASGAAGLRLRQPLATGWEVAGGAGVRFGAARLAGEPARPEDGGRSVVRPWGGPALTLGLGLARGHGCAALGLEGGWAVVGSRALAGDALAAALTGPWVGLSLSGGWRR